MSRTSGDDATEPAGKRPTTHAAKPMAGKVCLVTGGNSGIGLETCVALAERGADLFVVSRDRGRGEAAVAEIRRRGASDSVTLLVADLSSQKSVRELAADMAARRPRLDVLLNNAGAIVGERTLTEDGIETTFAVNHLAYFMLSILLLEPLRAAAPSRVVNVASEAHRSGKIDFDNLQGERSYGNWAAYAQSKLANIMFTHELSKRIHDDGVTANCLHPGVVATNFGKTGTPLVRCAMRLFRPFFTGAEQGAETSIHLASSPEVSGVTGKYFIKKREARSSPASYDESVAARLWSVSESMTGLSL